MKKVAIYARYSSDLQNPRSVDDQLRVCRDRAEREGWDVYRCYGDRATSGASMARSGLQELLKDASAGKFHMILTEALDRLSRDQADIATIFKRMQFAAIEIVTLSEGRVGILDIGLRGTMNQLYLVEARNKVRRGQQALVREGRLPGGNAYGYDMVRRFDDKGRPIRGERTINPSQARIIRRIFLEYARGLSGEEIARRLNKKGIPGPAGRPWTRNTIDSSRRRGDGIINNEKYIGQLVWNRKSYAKHPDTGKKVSSQNPETEWVRGQCPNLRIVEQKLWDRVKARQQRMTCPSRVAAIAAAKGTFRERRRVSLLHGLLKCGCCGGTFAMKHPDRYLCTRMVAGACTNRLKIERKALENKVFSALKQQFANYPERFAEFCAAYARQLNDLRSERAELTQVYRRELARVEAEYDLLTDVSTSTNRKRVPGISAELKGVIALHTKLARELRSVIAVSEPMETHYGDYVIEMVETIRKNRSDRDFDGPFRSQIGEIVLRPNSEGSELLVEVTRKPPRRYGRVPTTAAGQEGPRFGQPFKIPTPAGGTRI